MSFVLVLPFSVSGEDHGGFRLVLHHSQKISIFGCKPHSKRMIRRRGQRPEEDSSSDEEDAFATLSQKAKKPRTGPESKVPTEKPKSFGVEKNAASGSSKPKDLPISITSSMKRHHKTNDDRKARMEALLHELESEKKSVSRDPYRFVPEKKGSYVDPSEEHLTTNIFVGNLAPSITE